jgi:hypothetical protein
VLKPSDRAVANVRCIGAAVTCLQLGHSWLAVKPCMHMIVYGPASCRSLAASRNKSQSHCTALGGSACFDIHHCNKHSRKHSLPASVPNYQPNNNRAQVMHLPLGFTENTDAGTIHILRMGPNGCCLFQQPQLTPTQTVRLSFFLHFDGGHHAVCDNAAALNASTYACLHVLHVK